MRQININLLPYNRMQYKRKKIEFIFFVFGASFLTLLSIALWDKYIFYNVEKLEFRKVQLADQLASISPAKDLQPLKKQLEQLKASAQRLQRNHQHIRKILAILNDLKLFALGKFFIKTIEYKSDSLVIISLFPSRKLLLQLTKTLEKKYQEHFSWSYKLKKDLSVKFILKL